MNDWPRLLGKHRSNESSQLRPVKRLVLIIILTLPVVFFLSMLLGGLNLNDDHPVLRMLITNIYGVLWFLLLIPAPLIIPLVGTLFDLAVRPFKPDLSKWIIKGSWLLMVMLMCSGCVFTVLWSCYVYGTFYVHFDYIPVVDCSPFGLLIDHGSCLHYYHGMTEARIYELWSLYAILCWGTAIGLTLQTIRIANKSANRKRLITKLLFVMALTIVLVWLGIFGLLWYCDSGHTGTHFEFHYPRDTYGRSTNWTNAVRIRVPIDPNWRDGLYKVDVTIVDHDRAVLMQDQISLAHRNVEFKTVWTNFSDIKVQIIGNTLNEPNPELHYVLHGKTFLKSTSN